MMQEPNIPDELRPLRLVAGYSIRRDGVVFRDSDGEMTKAFSLKQAREYATADLSFDPNRTKRQPFGPVPAEELVCEDWIVEIPTGHGRTERRVRSTVVTRWVRLPAPEETNHDVCLDIGHDGKPALRRTHPEGRIEWLEESAIPKGCLSSGMFVAHGDTTKGWYRLRDGDGASVLFHGASVAATIFVTQ